MGFFDLFKTNEIKKIKLLENEIENKNKIIEQLTSKNILLENAIKEGEESFKIKLENSDDIPLSELENFAQKLEYGRKYEKAILVYSKITQLDEYNFHAYDRLLILTRKIKQYDNEMEIIKRYIKTYIEFYYNNSTINAEDKEYIINTILENINNPKEIHYDEKKISLLDVDIRLKISELVYRYCKSKYLLCLNSKL